MFEPLDFSETPCLAFGERGEPDLGPRCCGDFLLGQFLLIDIGNGLSASAACVRWVEMRPTTSVAQVTGCSREESASLFHGIQCLGKLLHNFRIPTQLYPIHYLH